MSDFSRPHDVLVEEIRRAHFGDAWHGPAVAELVHGLEAVEAAAHPVAGAHSIREVVLHGLAQHDAYHGGQIAMLKRALAVRDER